MEDQVKSPARSLLKRIIGQKYGHKGEENKTNAESSMEGDSDGEDDEIFLVAYREGVDTLLRFRAWCTRLFGFRRWL